MTATILYVFFIFYVLIADFGLTIENGSIRIKKWKEVKDKTMFFFRVSKVQIAIAILLVIVSYITLIGVINLFPGLDQGPFDMTGMQHGSEIYILLPIVALITISVIPSVSVGIISRLVQNTYLIIGIVMILLLVFSNNYAFAITMGVVLYSMKFMYNYLKDRLSFNEDKFIAIIRMFAKGDLPKGKYTTKTLLSILYMSQVFGLANMFSLLLVLLYS